MNSPSIVRLTFLWALLTAYSCVAQATTYTFELSTDQPWSDGGSTTTSSQTVTVRSYVPGSNTISYRSMAIYTPTYTSEANALGDVVGSVHHIYGSGTTAFVEPYDGPKRTIVYPAVQILHTNLHAVNDQRIALGTYYVLGGHAAGRGFLYDLIYDQYTTLTAPNTQWTSMTDISNQGQLVGTSINSDGAVRKGFVYDCDSGFEVIDVPGSSWTLPAKIDDDGVIYGSVSGIADASYFIATPDYVNTSSYCSLLPREDVAETIVFGASDSFELSGDRALNVRIGDFNGGGIKDLLIYHEPGKTILYLGEEGFDKKIKYYGDEFNTLTEGVFLESEWDFNNDGFIDKVTVSGTGNLLYIANGYDDYHYVPQQLPAGSLYFGDMNDDGWVDYVTVSGQWASIHYQTSQVITEPVPVVVPEPAPVTETPPEPDPIVEPTPEPAPEPAPVAVDVPMVESNARKVEKTATIESIGDNHVVLTSGANLWFNADSIIKFNDASGFEVGQKLEFKAWQNADGTLIGIKVEVN